MPKNPTSLPVRLSATFSIPVNMANVGLNLFMCHRNIDFIITPTQLLCVLRFGDRRQKALVQVMEFGSRLPNMMLET